MFFRKFLILRFLGKTKVLAKVLKNAIYNATLYKSASKSAKRCTFEILNPQLQNVLKRYLKMRNSKKVLQKVAKSALLKS